MTSSLYGAPLHDPLQVQPLLAEPTKHWKRGRSAFETATSWISAGGFPARVQALLFSAPEWKGAELLAGFFEHQTELDTSKGPTNTDLLALCGLADGVGVLAVEGKAGEPFGEIISKWNVSAGTQARYDWACAKLGVEPAACLSLRWQLFHRTLAAVLEAQRFRATHAAMLVHDFSPDAGGSADYLAFAKAMGIAEASVNGISEPKIIDGVSLRLAWVSDDCAKELS